MHLQNFETLKNPQIFFPVSYDMLFPAYHGWKTKLASCQIVMLLLPASSDMYISKLKINFIKHIILH